MIYFLIHHVGVWRTTCELESQVVFQTYFLTDFNPLVGMLVFGSRKNSKCDLDRGQVLTPHASFASSSSSWSIFGHHRDLDLAPGKIWHISLVHVQEEGWPDCCLNDLEENTRCISTSGGFWGSYFRGLAHWFMQKKKKKVFRNLNRVEECASGRTGIQSRWVELNYLYIKAVFTGERMLFPLMSHPTYQDDPTCVGQSYWWCRCAL